jgi:integrase
MQRVAKKVSANTANAHIRHIKAAYNWANENDMIKCQNPCMKIKPYRVDEAERHVPTIDEFQKALNVCETNQDRLMLLTYFETGARLREILGLRWSDVDLDNSSLRLWTGKRSGGREADWIGVSTNLVGLLREQQRETRFKEFVFISPKTGTKFYNRPKFFTGLV